MSDSALKYLHETAVHGSMRAAGEKLNVAVSSISRQIAQLEAAFGMRLLETGRRTIKLTPAGQVAFDFYRSQVAQQDAFAARLDDLREVKAGSVALVLSDGAPSLLVYKALATYQAQHPGIALSVNTAAFDEARRMILEDEAEIALGLGGTPDPKLRVRTSSPQPLTAVVHPGHALAQSQGVSLSQLAGHDLCLAPIGSPLRQLLAPAELRQQAWLRASITTNSMQTMRELALAGRAVAVLPRIAAHAELEDGTLVGLPLLGVEIEDPRLSLVVRLGRQLPRAASLLLAVVEQQMGAWSRLADLPPAQMRARAEG